MTFAQINDARSQYFKKDNDTSKKLQRLSINEVNHVKSSTVNPPMGTIKDANNKRFVKLPPRNDKDEPLCFNCSTYGDVSRYFQKPKKMKCTKCGKFGHEEKTCVTNTPVVSLILTTP
ncbi:uncharacterized protein LOC111039625 [Myzus persicae]|uniref:uncharacterized protein LOC111039625 n=1 Tax=Myzus persicae TaxID=13164 RepID=UPI000B93024E|nr:uncharacterized protein LOC111039625 [Myzus persicae]